MEDAYASGISGSAIHGGKLISSNYACVAGFFNERATLLPQPSPKFARCLAYSLARQLCSSPVWHGHAKNLEMAKLAMCCHA